MFPWNPGSAPLCSGAVGMSTYSGGYGAPSDAVLDVESGIMNLQVLGNWGTQS